MERIQTPYAVLNIDIQNGFCPEGDLPVNEGDKVVPVMNEVNEIGRRVGAEIVFTGDKHPKKTTHFIEFGGKWPPHCVEGTTGAEFHPDLVIDENRDVIIWKGMGAEEDAYSGFEARNDEGKLLDDILKTRGVKRLYVGGLATDYCVRATVLDGLTNGYEVFVIENGVRAVNIEPTDGENALKKMEESGAKRIDSNTALRELLAIDTHQLGTMVHDWDLKPKR